MSVIWCLNERVDPPVVTFKERLRTATDAGNDHAALRPSAQHLTYLGCPELHQREQQRPLRPRIPNGRNSKSGVHALARKAEGTTPNPTCKGDGALQQRAPQCDAVPQINSRIILMPLALRPASLQQHVGRVSSYRMARRSFWSKSVKEVH